MTPAAASAVILRMAPVHAAARKTDPLSHLTPRDVILETVPVQATIFMLWRCGVSGAIAAGRRKSDRHHFGLGEGAEGSACAAPAGAWPVVSASSPESSTSTADPGARL